MPHGFGMPSATVSARQPVAAGGSPVGSSWANAGGAIAADSASVTPNNKVFPKHFLIITSPVRLNLADWESYMITGEPTSTAVGALIRYQQ